MKSSDNLALNSLSLNKYAALVKQSSLKGGNTIVLENMIDKIVGMNINISSLGNKKEYNE